jgi:hypothetical protein
MFLFLVSFCFAKKHLMEMSLHVFQVGMDPSGWDESPWNICDVNADSLLSMGLLGTTKRCGVGDR